MFTLLTFEELIHVGISEGKFIFNPIDLFSHKIFQSRIQNVRASNKLKCY